MTTRDGVIERGVTAEAGGSVGQIRDQELRVVGGRFPLGTYGLR
jgi:hypothetical protein